MIHAISYILLYNFAITIPFTLKDHQTVKKITKNQMTVCWEYKADRIYFEMEAPTNGWIAIGFNSRNQIVGSYLLMGQCSRGEGECCRALHSCYGRLQAN